MRVRYQSGVSSGVRAVAPSCLSSNAPIKRAAASSPALSRRSSRSGSPALAKILVYSFNWIRLRNHLHSLYGNIYQHQTPPWNIQAIRKFCSHTPDTYKFSTLHGFTCLIRFGHGKKDEVASVLINKHDDGQPILRELEA
jgi:hypothetical protein